MRCPKCNSENIHIEDESFDYGEGHCGPAGTQVIKYPVCDDCGFDDENNEYNPEDWGYGVEE